MNLASVLKRKDGFYVKTDDDELGPFTTRKEAREEYYIKCAYDHIGSGIRDNSRDDKIYFGKKIDNGTWKD